jgi:hypothetical protein
MKAYHSRLELTWAWQYCLRFALALPLLILIGCKSITNVNSDTEYKIIGTCAPRDPVINRIEELLRNHNIVCYTHGSRALAITVPSHSAEEALQLLKRSEFSERIVFWPK